MGEYHDSHGHPVLTSFKSLVYLAHIGALLTCRKCGSLVRAEEMQPHADWHEGLIEDLHVPDHVGGCATQIDHTLRCDCDRVTGQHSA